MDILSLREAPQGRDRAAQWFYEKWSIPLTAYQESIDACLAGPGPVPQWYLALEDGAVIGGLGVIENDFHPRRDLAPNVCAVYCRAVPPLRWKRENIMIVLTAVREMGYNEKKGGEAL